MFSLDLMKPFVTVTLIAAGSAVVLAADNSVEVTLEDGLAPKGPRTFAQAKALGVAEAQKDIKAGHLHVLDYGKPAKPNETDPITGYPIQYLAAPRPTDETAMLRGGRR